jgi:hypothetical protein
MIILCRPGGKVTFRCANVLILLRTTSIPLTEVSGDMDQVLVRLFTDRSSDAFSSRTPSRYASPNNACARQWIDVVLPIPGIPYALVQQDRNDDNSFSSRFQPPPIGASLILQFSSNAPPHSPR